MPSSRANFAIGQKPEEKSTGVENLPNTKKDVIFICGIFDLLIEEGTLFGEKHLSDLGTKDFSSLLAKKYVPRLNTIHDIVDMEIKKELENTPETQHNVEVITKIVAGKINSIYGSEIYKIK